MLHGTNVLFIAANPASTDARAMKEARALMSAGASVHFLGRVQRGLPDAEIVDGIIVRRLDLFAWPTSSVAKLLQERLPQSVYDVLRPHAVQMDAYMKEMAQRYPGIDVHLRNLREH